jgi:predicted LPLAT superfamily acyltransferase
LKNDCKGRLTAHAFVPFLLPAVFFNRASADAIEMLIVPRHLGEIEVRRGLPSVKRQMTVAEVIRRMGHRCRRFIAARSSTAGLSELRRLRQLRELLGKGRLAPLAGRLAVRPKGVDALEQYVRTAPGRFAPDIAGRQPLKAERARLCRRLVQFEAQESRAETGPDYRERTCVPP